MVTRKSPPEHGTVNNDPPPTISIQGAGDDVWTAADSDPGTDQVWADQTSSHASTDSTANPAGAITPPAIPNNLVPGMASRASSYDQGEENPWKDDSHSQTHNLPPAPEPKLKLEEVPNALRPGPARSETNPFKRKPVQHAADVPSSMPTPPSVPTVLPIRTLNEPEQSTNPWQPALDDKNSANTAHPPAPQLSDTESGDNVWDSAIPTRQPSIIPSSNPPALLPSPSESDSQPWDDPLLPTPSLSSLPPKSPEVEEFREDRNIWDDVGSGNRSSSKGKQPQLSATTTADADADDWNLIDHGPIEDPAPGNLSKRSTWENFQDAEDGKVQESDKAQEPRPSSSTEAAPPLPPRRSVEVAPVAPPQPARPQSASAANKSETYQIKNINWFDATAAKNPRKTPILVQNANGPCPLLALVNALTLSTPADQTQSNLVEALRSREQISLGFLLDAVIDELMSNRHAGSDAPLPDMIELHKFLEGLHTGMNVNPRFIPPDDSVKAQQPNPLRLLSPERGTLVPGTFETTQDMTLYAAFSIPLIHGWLPPTDDPAYGAFMRQTSSYDDVQSLLFGEEELQYRLSSSATGLSEQEQQLYKDIISIKEFLSETATQLTPWGLEVITESMEPGTISILFRNDHFSTLYRHPQTHQLFTLVTDAGYYTHDEVVWESLADVIGKRAEFFSGDFRLVGGSGQRRQSDILTDNWHDEGESRSNGHEGGWQTVQSRRSRNSRRGEAGSTDPPLSPTHEQEDRDLALALQLQEEEEERHRAEQSARRRESQLSEQFIEHQGRQGNRVGPRGRGGSASMGGASPQTPARGSSMGQGRGGRPAQQVRSLISPVEDAPPSYEQASKATPYEPPAGHPSHPESSPRTGAFRRRTAPDSQSVAGPSTPLRGRQQNVTPVPAGTGSAQGPGGKDRDCIVM
ncbi:hypothetical protein F4778DRAFT_748750 [Xylariomycetidae sp. FL2044]|nr:hypothetical protein F4778DRAFT_748750 [Xylariomycetidae sp. FL2044]